MWISKKRRLHVKLELEFYLGPSQFINPYLFLSMKSPFLPVMPLGHEYYKDEPLTSSLKHSRIYMHFLAYIV